MRSTEKVYKVTVLPAGSEGKFLSVCGMDPVIYKKDVSWLVVRHARSIARGRILPEINSFQSSVIRFTDDTGVIKAVMATERIGEDGQRIPDSTVRLTNIRPRSY